jgi:hypothetical protein
VAKKGAQDQVGFDATRDRYPDFAGVLRAVLRHSEVGHRPVERVEVWAHASGEATYRLWEPKADEPSGGYLTPEQLGG